MLDTKEAAYVQAILEGKTQEEAGLAAGSKTIEGARKLATRMSKNVQVIEALGQAQNQALEQAGLTLNKAYKVINDGLEAVKIISSHTEPDYEVIDHQTRLKAAAMTIKLHESKKPENPQPKIPAIPEGINEVEAQRLLFRRTP